MAVDPVVQDFIARSMAENNRSLMSEISTLITNSVESIKRSNSEAVEDQLRGIKKIRREEPKSFKRKGNEVQYKFNAKIQDYIDAGQVVPRVQRCRQSQRVPDRRYVSAYRKAETYSQSLVGKQFKNTLNTN